MLALNLALVGAGLSAILFALLRRRAQAPVAPDAQRPDLPTVVLDFTIRLLDGDRAEWGQAMVGELASVAGRAARLRFVWGCLRAVILVPPRRGDFGRPVLALVLAGAAGSVGLVGYGLVQYPGLVTGAGTWVEVAAFVGVLAAYTVIVILIVRHRGAARSGLVAGLAVAALWFAVALVMVAHPAEPALMLLLLAIPAAALAVGAAGAWQSGTATAGRRVAVLAAVIAGLALFVALAGDTLLTAGRPYDAGQLRDFAASGAPDLATYAVSDNLGSAMVLLLLVPLLTGVLGCAGAALAARLRQARAAGRT